VHNNFYFLRQLCKALESTLAGAVVSECFSQSKDELIVRFEIGAESFIIKASLLPSFSCLSFPGNFQRARKNSVDLFSEMIGRHVLSVRQFNNERSFALRLSDDYDLLFKMHGNRTNILLFRNGVVNEVFRNNIAADLKLSLDALDREIDWSYENFERHAENLKSAYFTFGKVVWKYLEERNFYIQSTAQQWDAIQEVLKKLNNPDYYLVELEGKPALTLLEVGVMKKTFRHPVEACNEFYYTFTHLYSFSSEKSQLLNFLKSKLEAGEHYCQKNAARLEELRRDNHYKLWADLIMANLHRIQPGLDKVTLENFYYDQRPVEIKLKKDLTPQKNAGIFYKKAKNQHIEIDRIETSANQKQDELKVIQEKMQQVEAATDLKMLRQMQADLNPEAQTKKETASLPFHEFTFRDFRIWVGKNAQSNDTLTLKLSHKDDLWLHAKDVSGSHVLIKHQAGKNFPKDVIEFAASLAAYNSKRKNESLCPVIVTHKKFVRKRKGDPPGAVVVEREEVIMVEPAPPNPLKAT
jgi:predicted ribosome quality control (RQC) complex YloA/Tae2 family protein